MLPQTLYTDVTQQGENPKTPKPQNPKTPHNLVNSELIKLRKMDAFLKKGKKSASREENSKISGQGSSKISIKSNVSSKPKSSFVKRANPAKVVSLDTDSENDDMEVDEVVQDKSEFQPWVEK